MISWAAGLFEGDGSLTERTVKNRKYHSLNISSTDPDVLEMFQEVVGVGKIYAADHRNDKIAYLWQIAKREDIFQVAGGILPYLGERRSAIFKDRLGISVTKLEKTSEWAAGLFEAEGSVFSGTPTDRPNRVSIRASLGISDSDIMMDFFRIVDTGSICIENRPGLDLYRWGTSGKGVTKLYEIIGDCLGSRRGEAFTRAFEMRSAYESNQKHGNIKVVR